jgi:hypothetical protein
MRGCRQEVGHCCRRGPSLCHDCDIPDRGARRVGTWWTIAAIRAREQLAPGGPGARRAATRKVGLRSGSLRCSTGASRASIGISRRHPYEGECLSASLLVRYQLPPPRRRADGGVEHPRHAAQRPSFRSVVLRRRLQPMYRADDHPATALVCSGGGAGLGARMPGPQGNWGRRAFTGVALRRAREHRGGGRRRDRRPYRSCWRSGRSRRTQGTMRVRSCLGRSESPASVMGPGAGPLRPIPRRWDAWCEDPAERAGAGRSSRPRAGVVRKVRDRRLAARRCWGSCSGPQLVRWPGHGTGSARTRPTESHLIGIRAPGPTVRALAGCRAPTAAPRPAGSHRRPEHEIDSSTRACTAAPDEWASGGGPLRWHATPAPREWSGDATRRPWAPDGASRRTPRLEGPGSSGGLSAVGHRR